jgi:hypothetical protein
MRSSKSRSRSKQNRPRTLGNIINRVFDSSGPEGKVRGTPQQIIEKYQILARDAQLSNDRVAHENFMQHAEHYTRMLGEAQRELAAEQEMRRPEGGQQQRRDERDEGWGLGNGGGWQGNGNRQGQGRDDRGGERREFRPEFRAEPRSDYRQDPPRDFATEQPDVIDFDGDAGLVETPEARAPRPEPHDRLVPERAVQDRPPRERPPQDRAPAPEPAPEAAADPAVAEAEGQDKPARGPRRTRGPRKPRAEGTDAPPADPPGPREAAE